MNFSYQIERAQALAQLRALGYVDGSTVYLRLISKDDPQNLPTKKLQATFPDLPWEDLEEDQHKGYAVYFVVNGGGQRDKDVRNGRAIFCEWDDLPIDEQYAQIEKLGLPTPSFTVETRKSVHCYWVLSERLDTRQYSAETDGDTTGPWVRMQADLLAYTKSDQTIRNPSRVMRLAGSWHIKAGAEPIMCQLTSNTGTSYSEAELREVIPEQPAKQAYSQPRAQRPGATSTDALPLSRLLCRANEKLLSEGVSEGSRNDSGFKLACDLIGCEAFVLAIGLTLDATARQLIDDYGDRCSPPLGQAEIEGIYASAEKTNPEPATPKGKLIERLAYVRRKQGQAATGERKAKAKQTTEAPKESPPKEDKEESKSPSQFLVELATENGTTLFHDADGMGYADISIDGNRHTYRLRSREFRDWLTRCYWRMKGKTPNGQSVADALGVLDGMARFDGAEIPVHVRVAHKNGKVYLDLGTSTWECVEISRSGYRVIPSISCPVRFRRPKGLKPHPLPISGGKLSDFREFLNVDEHGLILILCWLIGCFSEGPYPVLFLAGEMGTGKTTAARLIRDLFDPGKAVARSQPKDERDLAIAASNSGIVSYDNLSHILDWLSDALCRLSTGGGLATRTLHSDDEETIFENKKPCMITGITNLLTRGDLQDRALTAQLQVIPDDRRTEERIFLERFEKARPQLLGALLNAVATALDRRHTVKLDRKPRMADFAVFAVAAAPAIGVSEEAILNALFANRDTATEAVLEASPVAQAILKFLELRTSWEGSNAELFSALTPSDRPPQGWPKSSRLFANELRRLAPSLRSIGITWVDTGLEKHGGVKIFRLVRSEKTKSPKSPNLHEEPEPAHSDGYRSPEAGDYAETRQSAGDYAKSPPDPEVSTKSPGQNAGNGSTGASQKNGDFGDFGDYKNSASTNGHKDEWEAAI